MALKKILILPLFLVLFCNLLLASWQEVVKRHLGTFLVFDKLILELSAQFKDINEEEKGAAALILAYSFDQLTKSVVSTSIENYYDKSTALERKEVSSWLKRYFEEFEAEDNDLLFLSPDREAVREDILAFRRECKKEFPLVYIEPTILELESFIKIKLHLKSSVNCGYEIYGEDSSLLAKGLLKKGVNERIVQVKKKPTGKKEAFIKLLVFKKYLNEKKITFRYPGTMPLEPKHQPQKYKGKHAVPNLVIGVSFFLINSQLVSRMYDSDSALPKTQANLDSSRKFLDTFAFGLIAKSFIDLCRKKGLCAFEKHKAKTYFGLFWSPFSDHEYLVYKQELRESAEKEGTNFFESDLLFSVLLKNNYELGLFYRRFKADDVFIAGGLWSTKKSVLGLTMGKVFTIADPSYKFPLDFSGGIFITKSYGNVYTFLDLEKNDKVVSESKEITYGLYTGVRLRFDLLRKISKPKLPVLTIGFKYFFPFNNFEYSGDFDAAYRLRRTFFFIGFYFR